jgi:FkbM family methyltransferase
LLSTVKHLLPENARRRLRVASKLALHRRGRLKSMLSTVAVRSIGEVLSCCEDFDSRPSGYTTLSVRGLQSPLILRNGTSDFAVFIQVFLDRQYELPHLESARYIIDAGANVGLSSLFFLSRNTTARVIAIEPDVENFNVAAKNLAPFKDRCALVHGALWSESGTLAIDRGAFRDGRHWATQTTPEINGRAERVRAYTIAELLSEFDFPRVDLLKVDIEGAELEVFRDGDTRFLEATNCCVVECHSDEAAAALRDALGRHPFSISNHGEVTVAKRSNAGIAVCRR